MLVDFLQHYVPQCYLSEWADFKAAKGADPVVWIFDRDGMNRRLDKVKNVLAKNDLYTLKYKGEKNYFIEKRLADLEGKYVTVFRDKILASTKSLVSFVLIFNILPFFGGLHLRCQGALFGGRDSPVLDYVTKNMRCDPEDAEDMLHITRYMGFGI